MYAAANAAIMTPRNAAGNTLGLTIVDPNVFPAALRGVMIAAFAAAYMSTIGTQLNWGASYLVNDFYKRFLVKGRDEKHYVRISQIATLLIMVTSAVVTKYQESVSG